MEKPAPKLARLVSIKVKAVSVIKMKISPLTTLLFLSLGEVEIREKLKKFAAIFSMAPKDLIKIPNLLVPFQAVTVTKYQAIEVLAEVREELKNFTTIFSKAPKDLIKIPNLLNLLQAVAVTKYQVIEILVHIVIALSTRKLIAANFPKAPKDLI